jgi:hypothetical protein
MIKENDRIRFIDEEMHEQYGVLLVFSIKGEFATVGKADYASFGQNIMTVKLAEIKSAE